MASFCKMSNGLHLGEYIVTGQRNNGNCGPERVLQDGKSGSVYVIRDVWSSAIACSPLVRCEYAVMEGDTRVWKPCVEGVLFADIEPFVTING